VISKNNIIRLKKLTYFLAMSTIIGTTGAASLISLGLLQEVQNNTLKTLGTSAVLGLAILSIPPLQTIHQWYRNINRPSTQLTLSKIVKNQEPHIALFFSAVFGLTIGKAIYSFATNKMDMLWYRICGPVMLGFICTTAFIDGLYRSKQVNKVKIMSQPFKKGGIAVATGAAAGLTRAASVITLNITRDSNSPIKTLAWTGIVFALGFIGFAVQASDSFSDDFNQITTNQRKSWKGLGSLAKLLVFGATGIFLSRTLINTVAKTRSPLLNIIFGPIMLSGAVLGTIFYLFQNNGNPQEVTQRRILEGALEQGIKVKNVALEHQATIFADIIKKAEAKHKKELKDANEEHEKKLKELNDEHEKVLKGDRQQQYGHFTSKINDLMKENMPLTQVLPELKAIAPHNHAQQNNDTLSP
jgi:hypothetical protein